MKRVRFFLMTVLLVLACIIARPAYSYLTLDVPGAGATYALGVSGNNVVGAYGGINASQGFLYNGTRPLMSQGQVARMLLA